MAPKHLRSLAVRINHPHPTLRSTKNHPTLAAHLALLISSGYVRNDCTNWQLTMRAHDWLNQPFQNQLPELLTQIEQPHWQAAFTHLTRPEAASFAACIQQALKIQTKSWLKHSQDAVRWGSQTTSTEWQFLLPDEPSPWLLFHLLQLGSWKPAGEIFCTAQSLATSPARHYGYDRIRWLLETATQQKLSKTRQAQLREWLQFANVFRLRGNLLSTAQPEQMLALRKHKRLRGIILEDLAPRHVLIDPTKLPQLKKWLARQGYSLNPDKNQPIDPQHSTEDLDYHWLGLRLLSGLQTYLPGKHSPPPPYAQMHNLEKQMPSSHVEELEGVAQRMISGLGAVIQGRDAFFPAYNEVPANSR